MNENSNDEIFPKQFVWGASTASNQVGGGTLNQWTVWELGRAQEHAQTADQRLKGMSKWQEQRTQAGNT